MPLDSLEGTDRELSDVVLSFIVPGNHSDHPLHPHGDILIRPNEKHFQDLCPEPWSRSRDCIFIPTLNSGHAQQKRNVIPDFGSTKRREIKEMNPTVVPDHHMERVSKPQGESGEPK